MNKGITKMFTAFVIAAAAGVTAFAVFTAGCVHAITSQDE